jgi:hypothetical protein
MPESDLQKEMLREANLILDSIDWLENQIDKKIILFDKAMEISDFEVLKNVELEIETLLLKLHKEEENMDNYMIKYRKLIKDEKEKILHNPK